MASRNRRHSNKTNDRDDDEYYSDDFVSDEESDIRDRRVISRKRKSPRSKSHLKKGKGLPPDNVTQRMMSAGRLKMNELRNHVEECNIKIKDLLAENKILKKMQYRHEKALNNFQNKESNLPQLLTKHANEVRSLKEQLRLAREKFERSDRYLRDAEDDLERSQKKLKKYMRLAEEKGLPERDELNRKLSKAEIDLEEKDLRIKELEKHIEHLSKNHRHELGIEMASHRETKKQMEEFKNESGQLKNKIKEREKELDIKNIYSNRVMRNPHKLPASYSGTPFESPSPSNGGMHAKIASLTDLSSREKAKLYEKKRRKEGRNQREVSEAWEQKQSKEKVEKQNSDLSPQILAEEVDFFRKQRNSLDDDRQRNERENREREERYFKEKERKEREDREWRDFEAKRQDQEHEDYRKDDQTKLEREQIRRESTELEKHQREEKLRREFEEQKIRERDDEIRDREMRERIEKEQQERRDRENRERIEREEKEKKEREERDRRERDERERREQEEKLKNDINYQEERMKKDLLLARMKAIDEGIVSSGSEKGSPTPSRKSYHHTIPTKNLHNGKPAYNDLPWLDKSKKTSPDELDRGGYQPSFSSPSGKKGQDKGDKLMESLFGNLSKSKTSSKQNDSSELLSSSDSAPKKPTPKKGMFPWDQDNKVDQNTKQSESLARRENSNTMIFGGGAAFVEDDRSPTQDNPKLLPRRPRVPVSTLQSKPSITAVDSIEDEIEEVII